MKYYIFTLLILLGICPVHAQVTVTGTAFQNGYYSLGGYSYNAGNVDPGTNYYTKNYNDGFGLYTYQLIKRDNDIWKHRVTTTYQGGGSADDTYVLHLPPTSNEADPPCAGVWEEWAINSGTGNYVFVTMTGSCSTVDNPPSPIQATTMSSGAVQLPRYFDFDIPGIPNPQVGMMIWDITNACVKTYDGTNWNCL